MFGGMISISNLMIDYNISHNYTDLNGCFLVHCPEFSPTGFEVCNVLNGQFTSQANNENINNFISSFIEIL